MSTQKILQTDSIQELAEFWDTHDLTDFEEELEEVTEPVFERKTVVELHLQSNEVEVVQKIAKSKGVESTTLIREWVLEKIRAA